ncbi:MAG: hypothetical protein LC808_32250 [Actinobacteria bacterium]|nr:hypothetical protein [Actinomycetota bacterium]
MTIGRLPFERAGQSFTFANLRVSCPRMSYRWIRQILPYLACAAALATPAAAEAASGFSVEGLKITPPVGAFGGTKVGSCDLVTYTGCPIRTFTLTNVGAEPILIGGFGIFGLTAALVFGSPGSGCEFLPQVGGYWSLEPGASCIISVAFSPDQRGRVENELHIWYTDQSNPIAVVPLFGVGTGTGG